MTIPWRCEAKEEATSALRYVLSDAFVPECFAYEEDDWSKSDPQREDRYRGRSLHHTSHIVQPIYRSHQLCVILLLLLPLPHSYSLTHLIPGSCTRARLSLFTPASSTLD